LFGGPEHVAEHAGRVTRAVRRHRPDEGAGGILQGRGEIRAFRLNLRADENTLPANFAGASAHPAEIFRPSA
jgi:hypothetical protein